MCKKLTYNGNECNSYLYFSFDAAYFDTDEITEELKIKPTSVMIKNKPVPKSTSWEYRIDVGKEIDLEIFLEKLINVFESKIDDINRLKKKFQLDTRIQFVIDIDINPNSSTPYFGINKRVIDFLFMTKTMIDYDLYKVNTTRILND